MSICPYCQSGSSDIPASGGRCPVCGNPLAWGPPELSVPDPYAGLGLGEIQPPPNMTMPRQGGMQHFGQPVRAPAEDPVATLKNTLARIVMRAADSPGDAPAAAAPHSQTPPPIPSLLAPNTAPVPPPAARNPAPPRSYPTPRGNEARTVELDSSAGTNKPSNPREGMATLESGTGLTTPGDGAVTRADKGDGAAPSGGRKRPSTFDERRMAQTMDSGDIPPADADRVAQLWRGTFSPTTTPRTSLKGAGGITARDSRLVIKHRAMRDSREHPIPEPGTEYELLNVIGEGGMGVVYSARQASIDRTVAIKMLKPDIASHAEQREKFLSEAVVTGDLDHPNIVPIYDLGANEKGALFYSMKRVEGTPWMAVIEQKSTGENIEILMKVADAVAFAHSRGVIHRDLKPENVMLGDYGEVLVMDWGLALSTDAFRKSGSITQTSSMGGTPAYMAPEMATGPIDRINLLSDVYLLGSILYEIVAGHPPHTGKNVMNCLFAAARNEIQPTERTGELLEIALRAMSTKQEERHASVQDFQNAIRAYQSHSESIVLSTRAEADLAAAGRSGDYQTYSRALFAFQEAFALWDGNTTAKLGISKAKLAYATQALKKEDYDLAASLLDARDPAHAEVRRRIVAAQRERDTRQQRLRNVKRLAVGLVAAMLAVVGVAFFNVNKAKNNALWAQQTANDQRDIAVNAEKIATKAKAEAVESATNATKSAQEASDAAATAFEAEKTARAAEKRAQKDRDTAQRSKEAEEYQAYVARIGLAAAEVDDNAFDTAEQLLNSCPPRLRNWEWGRLWHLSTQSVRDFRCDGPVDSVAMTTDGKRFASGSWDGQARIWDVATGKTLLTIPYGGLYVHAVAFSPDGELLATGGNDKQGYLKIWNSHTGALVRTITGHTDDVLSVVFSKDGRRLLSSSYDKTARLWDVETGREIQRYLGHNWWVWSAEFSPDQQQIVTASQDGTAIVWSTATGQAGPPFTGHLGPVYAAAFSPDGKSVVSGGYDNRLLIWRLDELKPFNYQAVVSGGTNPPPKFRALEGHTAAIDAVAFSPNGHLILSASNDNTIKLWDFASGRLIKSLRGHAGRVRSAVFSADGANVLSGSHDETVKLWDVAGYEEVRVLQGRVLQGHSDAVLSAEFSRDGRRIVTASRDRTAKVWDTATGQVLKDFAEGHEYLVSTATFSPKGKRLLTAAADNTARIWDVSTGTQTLRLEGIGHGSVATLSHDGRLVLTASDEDTARIWDAAEGKLLRSTPVLNGEVTAVAFAPDDQTFFTGDVNGHCRLWKTTTAELLSKLDTHSAKITAAEFTSDGHRVLTASADWTVGQWDVATGQEPLALIIKHPGSVLSMAVVPGTAEALTLGDDGTVRLWNIDRAEVVAMLGTDEGNSRVAASADGRLALCVNYNSRTVRVWDLKERRQIPAPNVADSKAPFLAPSTGLVWAAAFSPDSRYIVTVGGNGARLWDMKTGKEQISFSPNGAVASANFSLDGHWIVTGSWDNSAKIWDVESGHDVRKLVGHRGYVNAASFSPDGKWVLTASDDRTARLWDTKTGEVVRDFVGHKDRVTAAVFSPDGDHVLTASADKTARLWDPRTGRLLHEFKGHIWAVSSVAFSADGERIITGSADNTAIVWNVESGAQIATLAGHTAPITSVAFAPDGQRVLTGSQDNTAKLWDPATGKEIMTLKGHSQEVTSVTFSNNGRDILTASRDGRAIIWLASDWHRQPANKAAPAAPTTNRPSP
jgi:hypothetical protein